jgi:hypothetical protein
VSSVSITDVDSVDNIAETNNGEVLMVITDHLEWENLSEHLTLLEKKLSTYVFFLESGMIFERHENLRGKKFILVVDCKYPPAPGAIDYIDHVRPIVQGYGFQDLRCLECSNE